MEYLYIKTRAILGISYNDFLDMTIKECLLLIKEKNIYDNMLIFNLAYSNSLLIMNENANDNKKILLKDITGEETQDNFIKDIERYKMISERLKLKFPKNGKGEYLNVS